MSAPVGGVYVRGKLPDLPTGPLSSSADSGVRRRWAGRRQGAGGYGMTGAGGVWRYPQRAAVAGAARRRGGRRDGLGRFGAAGGGRGLRTRTVTGPGAVRVSRKQLGGEISDPRPTARSLKTPEPLPD